MASVRLRNKSSDAFSFLQEGFCRPVGVPVLTVVFRILKRDSLCSRCFILETSLMHVCQVCVYLDIYSTNRTLLFVVLDLAPCSC